MSEKIMEYKNIKIGKLKIEKSLIDNDEYRKVTIRNRAGKVILIKNYKNNKLSGKIESYWPNGKVHFKGQFTNGVRSSIKGSKQGSLNSFSISISLFETLQNKQGLFGSFINLMNIFLLYYLFFID